jgi:hypothetical protein
LCDEPPPDVPTHTEYTLPTYDGTVLINSMTYPEQQRTINQLVNSSMAGSSIPRNYHANLTYTCGDAREFFVGAASQGTEQSMTCQWNKTWAPTHQLAECDWVACLKPPTPPASTNLRVTDWDGAPIKFGDMVHFVCRRGTFFEENSTQVEVTYTCQDGSVPDTNKGFFDVPGKEKDWPRCLLGIFVWSTLILITKSPHFSTTLPCSSGNTI